MTQLLSPLSGRMARAGLSVLFATVSVAATLAQTKPESATKDTGGYNREVRTRTWSIHALGGASWAAGLWYQDYDAKKSYGLSPAVGGGVDFNIRPWVRVGAEYIWSRYRREQRFTALDHNTIPVKAYGNYLMNAHNVKLGAGFNLMERWPGCKAQWLNVWLGTGVGFTMARGNEYGIWLSTTQTQGGTTTPIGSNASVGNSSTVTITGNVKTTNSHEKFNKLYIPASLHVEADVSRQFTVGLKGEMDWFLNREDMAPKNLIFALASIRYNFVPGETKTLKRRYKGDISALNDRINAMQREIEAEKEKAGRCFAERERMQRENSDLQNRLDRCEKAKAAPTGTAEKASHFVQFEHNSSFLSHAEGDRLKAFARTVKGRTLSLIAEASTPGTEKYNQLLSEKRLMRVIEALVKEGLSREDLKPAIAIGSQNRIPTSEGRRVTITAE